MVKLIQIIEKKIQKVIKEGNFKRYAYIITDYIELYILNLHT